MLLVACLCAAWCGTCRDYQPVFDAEAAASGEDAEFRWIDIEDHEEAIDGLEVENFPTLLIAWGDTPLFYGPVLPHAQTLSRLVRAARDGDLEPLHDATLASLPARLRQIA